MNQSIAILPIALIALLIIAIAACDTTDQEESPEESAISLDSTSVQNNLKA
jgi:hypothetical protein